MARSSNKSPWPTKAAMTQVYQNKLWGNNGNAFYSGLGSHHPDLVKPYVNEVISFLKSFDKPVAVCDLGCGDFNVGRHLVAHAKHYVGVDIVQELIDFNSQNHQLPNLEFRCLDIAKNQFPKADVAILRQVLQHLSNAEIKQVVDKLDEFKYVILTEHLPEGAFRANLDIISGQGIRLKKHSGVDLLSPPFDLKVKSQRTLLDLDAIGHKGRIVTTLFEL